MNNLASPIDQESQMQSIKIQSLPILRMILTDENNRPDKNANNPATQQLRALFRNPYSFHQAKALIVDDPSMYELLKNKEHQKIVDHPSYKRLIEELEDAPIRSEYHSLPIKSDGGVNMYLVCNDNTPAYDDYAANTDEAHIQLDDTNPVSKGYISQIEVLTGKPVSECEKHRSRKLMETFNRLYPNNKEGVIPPCNKGYKDSNRAYTSLQPYQESLSIQDVMLGYNSFFEADNSLPQLTDEASIQSEGNERIRAGSYISQHEVLIGKPVSKGDKANARSILREFAGLSPLDEAYTQSEDKQLLNQQYEIVATGRQVDDISYACELAARAHLGQINAIIDALPIREGTDTYALQQQIEALIKPHLKQPEQNLPPFFTLHQTLRHRRSWDIHPEGGMTVNFDEPLVLTDDPLLKISKVF